MLSAGKRDRISDYYLFTRFHLNSNLMMGCASSQAVPPGGIATTSDPDKDLVDSSKPGASEDSSTATDDKYPPAEAFEISLDDVDNDSKDRSDSLIKKHPPKRLQKLVEQAATASAVSATTIEHLEEKLAKAEVRRQQYIQQRIENIITLTSSSKGGGSNGGGEADVNSGGEENKDGDGDGGSDGQKEDADAAVIVSRNTSRTTTSSNSNSSQDADVVVQSTTSSSLNETPPAASVDKKHIDGEHHAQGADNNDNGTRP
ncbi:uncharacterized protein LOC129942030 [Eupeodes corollae]|uniref:uncharacterized protein LOC129942030 n=1 Tax=Eupeodes corollae TaxID=290404 RepID=UPI00249213C3|nr:uncharacterized protein LOC129942030 [Eupeodes corollae]